MPKPKIIEIASEDYPQGRIDSFKINLSENLHQIIIPIFLELDFPEELVLEKLDTILSEQDYIFIYGNNKIKAHLIIDKQNLSIKFDTTIPKSKFNKIIEKYFQFPE